MAKLNEATQRFIVQALACYDTPTQVAEAVKEEFGIEINRQQAASYDPTKVTSKALAKKWRDLFAATRKAFLEQVSEIPIANQAYRLRQLDRIAVEAMRRKNVVLAAQIIEQAAKETGGMFTNKREMTGAGGAPLYPSGLTHFYGGNEPDA
ncbi:DUF2280 domain-containing protein [Bordetella bronchiseptica]|uniref:DUF2280 domain-containing protein n=1 Tax=Bordetella bronchiseptica TaxID=518 RepID=UPI000459ECBD|nr:DUF2280 domain-containing protein [Bordetella bronchiseptica]KAK52530.1 PF10045 family protein [Bordetella bronchiseptica OSU054]KDB73075.1 PF10045 family protein [Bordetella bronchiseptica B20-10725633]KDC23883.1 PF10045 family protein [Bordetella bronchiseptica F4563]KDD40916.1 PF10045 family protein [Bordetella bronchiseptica OSU095]